jgi:FlgD Ig-like domain
MRPVWVSPPNAPRVVAAVAVVGLLGGSAGAFALTEQLKLERSPVFRTHVGKLLGPNCRCRLARIPVRFFLRKSDRLTLTIVDSHRRVVRTLTYGRRRPAGVQQFTWNGRDNAGRVVAAGTYRPRIHLAGERRTILMPNPIRVDPIPPAVRPVSVSSSVFSPDGDRRRDYVRIRFRTSERARGLLFVNGRFRVRGNRYVTNGVLRWFGYGLPAGRYRLVLRAVDLAGNVSRTEPVGFVRIRFITARPHVLHPLARARIGFRVRTDARFFHWTFGHRSGNSRPGLLLLRAPAPGRYVLVVREHGHSARAVVFVEPRR